MSYADVLLYLDSYPDPLPDEVVDEAAALAFSLGGAVTAIAPRIDFPLKSNPMANLLVGLGAMVEQEQGRSLANAEASLARFNAAVAARRASAETHILHTTLYEANEHVAALARTFDLCIMPMLAADDGQRAMAEAVMFGSGRPVLLLPLGPGAPPCAKLERIVIAWDGGRASARAVADAMPVLKAAAQVNILTVLNEKKGVSTRSADALGAHLSRHGVTAAIEVADASGRAIGEVIERRVADLAADLLVMGAFGHSRAREFILGGATQSVLFAPPSAVLLSH